MGVLTAVERIETEPGGLRDLLKETVKRSVVLLALVVPLVAVCWQVSEQLPIGGLTIGVYALVAGMLILCEHSLAFDAEWGSALQGSKTDFLYVIVATLMDKGSFVVCVAAVASLGREIASFFQVSLWPSGWSFVPQLLAALLIADLGAYLRHRLFHRSALLWRFHQIHHSMTKMYWIRSAYTHPVEQFFILMAIMLPIAFLGAGNEVVAVVAFLFGLSGLLQHANVDSHSSLLNYLFGTYYHPSRSEVPVRVGLEGVTAFPKEFLTHLAMPFRREPTAANREEFWEGQKSDVPAAKKP